MAGSEPVEVVGRAVAEPRRPVALRWLWPRQRRAGGGSVLAGSVILLIFVVGAILASSVHDAAYRADPGRAFAPPVWQGGGSWSQWLGADELGRDVFARLLYGIRVSLLVGLSSVVVATLAGLLVGVVAGYSGGWVDNILMRLTDGLLAIPVILLAISVIGAVGASGTTLVLVLAASQWMSVARVARSETLGLRQRHFVTAEVALGAKPDRIVTRHIFPHVVPSMLVLATLSLPNVILLEAGLDFLGLGMRPPTPSIGGMISSGLQYLSNAWWLAIVPGIVLMVVVVGINLLGDGVRDLLDR